MSLISALTAHLKNDPAVSAITTRIYPLEAPLSAKLPYLTYLIVGGNDYPDMLNANSLNRSRIDINSLAETALESESLYLAVKKALNAYKGDMQGLDVRNVVFEDVSDAFISNTDGSEAGSHERRASYNFHFYEV